MVDNVSPKHVEDKQIRGTVLDFGVAPYKHDDKNKDSFFVKLEQLDGKSNELWGVDLKNIHSSEPFVKGEYIGLKRTSSESVKVPIVDDNGNDVEIDALRRSWSKSNLDYHTDFKNYEAQISSSSQKESLDERKEDKNNEKYVLSDKEIDEQVNSPSLERLVPSFDITNRYLVKMGANSNEYYDRRNPQQRILEDTGKDIKVNNATPEAIELLVKMAKEKDWKVIEVSGTNDFKRQTWLEATKEGIEVKGYTPTPEELKSVEKYFNVEKNSKSKTDNVVSPLENDVNSRSNLKNEEISKSSNDNLVKPIVEDAKDFAAKNISGKDNQKRFTERVEQTVNKKIDSGVTPVLKDKVVESPNSSHNVEIKNKERVR